MSTDLRDLGFAEITAAFVARGSAEARQERDWRARLREDLVLVEQVVRELVSIALAEANSADADTASALRAYDFTRDRSFGGDKRILLALKKKGFPGSFVNTFMNHKDGGSPTLETAGVSPLAMILECQEVRNAWVHPDRPPVTETVAAKIGGFTDSIIALATMHVLRHICPFEISVVDEESVVAKCKRDGLRDANARLEDFGTDKPVPGAEWYFTKPKAFWSPLGRRLTTKDDLQGFLERIRAESRRPKTFGTMSDDRLDAFQNGNAVAVLGPEFGVPLWPEDPAADHVARRYSLVLSKPVSADLSAFLECVLQRRTTFLRGELPETDPQPAPEDVALRKVIWSLTHLTYEVTTAFGRVVASGRSVPRDLSDWVITLTDAEWKPIRSAADKCIGDLQLQHIKSRDWAVGAQEGGLAARINELARGPELDDDTIAWLCDAIWHLFRFDAPFYPDQRSLAVQLELSVHVGAGKPLSVSGGTAALLAPSQAKCVSHLFDWMRQHLKGHKTPTQPAAEELRPQYLVLASTVYAGWQALSKGKSQKSSEPMFVVDTNFDQELVVALESFSPAVPYSVVFPIWVKVAEKQRSEEDVVTVRDVPAWGVRERVTGEDHYLWWIMPPAPDMFGNSPVEGLRSSPLDTQADVTSLRGIVVVKAHGAPLEPLLSLESLFSKDSNERRSGHPTIVHLKHCFRGAYLPPERFSQVGDKPSDDKRVGHRILFDDYRLIDDVLHPNDSLPPGLRKYLQPVSKELWFMGYSVRDFTRRLRIVADRRSETGHKKPHRPCWVVSCDREADRAARSFLDKDGVTVYKTNLPEMVGELGRELGIRVTW